MTASGTDPERDFLKSLAGASDVSTARAGLLRELRGLLAVHAWRNEEFVRSLLECLLELGIEQGTDAVLLQAIQAQVWGHIEAWNEPEDHTRPTLVEPTDRFSMHVRPGVTWGPHQAVLLGAAARDATGVMTQCTPAELDHFRLTYRSAPQGSTHSGGPRSGLEAKPPGLAGGVAALHAAGVH